MTVYGPDVSSYQHGLSLSQLRQASFVLAKTTEGTYYADPDYAGWRAQASAIGRPFIWYHFLSGEDAHAQAAHTLANVGDPTLPGMLDVEPEGEFTPTLEQVIAYIDAAHAADLNLKIVYLPHWFWQQLGQPDLTAIAARGVHLVSSAYPGGSGGPETVYPGDTAAGWDGYGGMVPLLYQYTNQASDAGQLLDYNAFRGTVPELLAALGETPAPAPPPTPNPLAQEDDMPATNTGEVTRGEGAVTMVCPPPGHSSPNWGDVWFSLGCDFGDAHVRIAAWVHGVGWHVIDDVLVPSAGDRVNPFNGPLPAGTQKISIRRDDAASASVPLAWLIEAVKP